jgi:hypothetical protein
MTRKHTLGPITRLVMAQRRAGVLDPAAARDTRVYLRLLRAAVEADRRNRLDPFHAKPRNT